MRMQTGTGLVENERGVVETAAEGADDLETFGLTAGKGVGAAGKGQITQTDYNIIIESDGEERHISSGEIELLRKHDEQK